MRKIDAEILSRTSLCGTMCWEVAIYEHLMHRCREWNCVERMHLPSSELTLFSLTGDGACRVCDGDGSKKWFLRGCGCPWMSLYSLHCLYHVLKSIASSV